MPCRSIFIWLYVMLGCIVFIVVYGIFLYGSKASLGSLGKNSSQTTSFGTSNGLPEQTAPPAQAGVPSLGLLTPFYRSEPIQGPYAELDPGTFELTKIPSYLTDPTLDYPYHLKSPNPSGLEIPYVSTFLLQRSLGGWSSNFEPSPNVDAHDLVRKTSSGWVTDYAQLTNALKPFLDAGYAPSDITITLDNVPWDLSTNTCADGSVEGMYGNRSPVSDYAELSTFMAGLANSLNTLTNGHAGEFRFKVGSEYNTSKSFCGSLTDYEKYYSTIVAALKQVIPNPLLLPFEFSASETHVGPTSFSTIALYQWLAASHLPVVAIARSDNNVLVPGDKARLPSSKAQAILTSLNAIYTAQPSLKGTTPEEIDQFGVVSNDASGNTSEAPDNGPRSASWSFQSMFLMLAQVPSLHVTHWDLFDAVPIGGGKRYLLPTALSWLYQILDNLQGTRMYGLSTAAAPTQPTIETYAMGFASNTRFTILASSYNETVDGGQEQQMNITIPAGVLPNGASRYEVHTIPMAVENTPEYALKELLEQGAVPGAGLAGSFTKDSRLVGVVNDMAASSNGGSANQLAINAVGTALVGKGQAATTIAQSIHAMFTLQLYNASALTKNANGSYTLDAGTFSPGEMKLFTIESN